MAGLATNDDVAMVWSQPGKHSLDIVYSHRVDDEWSDPVYLTNSKLDGTAPAIVGDADGNQWVMWAEANGLLASTLHYRIKDATTGEWGDVHVLTMTLSLTHCPHWCAIKRDSYGVSGPARINRTMIFITAAG